MDFVSVFIIYSEHEGIKWHDNRGSAPHLGFRNIPEVNECQE